MPETTEQKKLFGLDHLRALAILLVFFYHYSNNIFGHPKWLNDYAKFGWTGVDLFFVLSGYLISSQLFLQIQKENTISFRNFYLKRLLRIMPAFLITLLVYFCVPLFHERETLFPVWRYLTFTQNFGLDLRQTGTFSHAWSLCVEEHFYLLFPLLLLMLVKIKWLKRSYLLLVVFFVLGFVTRFCSWHYLYIPKIDEQGSWAYWYKFIYYPTYNRLDGLLIGVSIAAIQQFAPRSWSKFAPLGNYFLLLSIGVLTAAYFVCYEEHSYVATVFGFPLVDLGYGFMVMGAISPASFLYKWKSSVTTLIAALSFSIYLTHKGIMHATQTVFSDLPEDSGAMMLICIVTCFLGALLLNVIIERPFLKLKNRLASQQ